MFKSSFIIFCFLLVHKFNFISSVNNDNYLISPVVSTDDWMYFQLTRNPRSNNTKNFRELNVRINFLNDYRLRVHIQNHYYENQNFEVPIELDLDRQKSNLNRRLYRIKLSSFRDDESILTVIRKSNNKVVWKLNLGSIEFRENLVQATNTLASHRLFGLGEHVDYYMKRFQNESKTILLYNTGALPRPENPLYGSHPIYLNYEQDSNAHSVFLMNSNAMEITLSPQKTITWKAHGGILDFFLNLGPTPQKAVQQYVSLVGRPPLVPYTALGFHVSRWGFWNLKNTKAALQRTIDAKIPIDYIWNDIDVMDRHNDFTISPLNFSGLSEFVDDLHKNHRRYAFILDPGMPSHLSKDDYPQFYEALEQGILLTHPDGKLIEGKVWNSKLTAFPDFTNPKTQQFWTSNLMKLNKKVDYDMLWIDMNEIALLEPMKDCKFNLSEQMHDKILHSLHNETVCYNAKHYLGKHSEVHNLYGYFQGKMTRNALLNMNKRPFIISRSTFAGSGRYVSHWTGDVFSTWHDLKYTISTMLEFNILGIPVVGADICGFVDEPTEELCARWQSLGSFYPFSRNHNTINTKDQDPGSMSEVVQEATRYALRLRYNLLSLLYTELFKSSQDGRPAVKSMSLIWPEDESTYREDQFLWGDKLMVIPIIEEKQTEREVYLPKGRWYDYPTMDLLTANSTRGTHLQMTIPLDRIKLAIRGGSILFTQKAEMTTYETRQNNFTLIVALDENEQAEGDLYLDDGESVIADNHRYSFVEAKSNSTSIKLTPVVSNYLTNSVVDCIKISGQNLNQILKIYLNGREAPIRATRLNSNSYIFENLSLKLNEKVEIKWN